MDLIHDAAHLLREEDAQKRKQLRDGSSPSSRKCASNCPYRTKTKYERIRIDFQSGRLR